MLGSEWRVEDLRAHPDLTSPEEDGTTFEANARIKAEAASAALPGLLVLADDSGLEVDALDGAPGVHSARYAGASATDADNRQRLKQELRQLGSPGPFTGRFRCCLALARDGQTLTTCHGAVEGTLLTEEAGSGGFGYDPLFVPDGFSTTFGLLPAEEKNTLSHRSRALQQMLRWLEQSLTFDDSSCPPH